MRQTIVVLAIPVVLALGALGDKVYVTVQRQAAAAANAPSDDELYTGSILFMPDEGNICRELLFNNQTGRFSDNGYVECERAAYHGSDEPKQFSSARARVISDGFRFR